MVTVCECCGHPLPSLEVQLELTRRQRDIFAALQKAGVAGITVSQLVDKIYSHDPDGGPDTAENVIHVQRWKMKDRLAKYGMQITTTKGHGSLWRLEKL